MKSKPFPALLFLLAALSFSGCVSTVVEDDTRIPRLVIAQGGDGRVSISWESRPDHVYTVYYQDRQGGDWLILRGADRIPGNGSTLTVHDRVNPNRPPRRYRLLPEKK